MGTWYRPLLPPRWIPALRRHQQQVQVCAHLFPSGCPPPRLHREKSKFPSQVPKFSSHDEFPRKGVGSRECAHFLSPSCHLCLPLLCRFFTAYATSNELRFPDFFSESAVNLLCGLLAIAPSARLSWEELEDLVKEWIGESPGDASDASTCSSTDDDETSARPTGGTTGGDLKKKADASLGALERNSVPQPLGLRALKVSSESHPAARFNSPDAEQDRKLELCAAGALGRGSVAAMRPPEMCCLRLRHLGWERLNSPSEELFNELCGAVERIGLRYERIACACERTRGIAAEKSRSSDTSVGTSVDTRVIVTERSCVSDRLSGGEAMSAKMWVTDEADGTCTICVKRLWGDTFQFHAFYHQLRQMLSPLIGWTGHTYQGGLCVPGAFSVDEHPGPLM